MKNPCIYLFVLLIGLCTSCNEKETKEQEHTSDSVQGKNRALSYMSLVDSAYLVLAVDSFYSNANNTWTYALAVETKEYNKKLLPEDSLYDRELWIIRNENSDLHVAHKLEGLIESENKFLYGPGFSSLSFDKNGILIIDHQKHTGEHFEDFRSTEYYSVIDTFCLVLRNYVFTYKKDYSEKLGWKYIEQHFRYDAVKNNLFRTTTITRFGGDIQTDSTLSKKDTLIIPDSLRRKLLLTPLDEEGFLPQ